ncbi:MAG TPA: LD-carboxypeptidase [Dehalococcoidia bacterium]|jgi:muramoyltetrapeptide carboxypeptidase LdcA involved in peptidoglycan recycling
MIPRPLQVGDGVRVVAPAQSLASPWMTEEMKAAATARLQGLGLVVSFGRHVNDIDEFVSTTVAHRVADIHDAFSDKSVQLILSVVGGYNSNQLLSSLDFSLLAQNPKRLCGFSDITALGSAILAKAGLVTYSGPHFISFSQARGFDYTLEYFQKCHFHSAPYAVRPATSYADGMQAAGMGQFEEPKPWLVLSEGEATGTVIGGNLCTLQALCGTQFMPAPDGDLLLFLEDDYETYPASFDRDLQSLLHQPLAQHIRALCIGRFQSQSGMTGELLGRIVRSKPELADVPVIADLDFGHTVPVFTFPIGGTASIRARGNVATVEFLSH